jgi:tyrosyl-tRNA synthetase
MTNLLDLITDRGFVSDCTDSDSLRNLLGSDTPQPIYIGFDCTAPSLHVGSLIQIMILRHIQKCGHKPVVLMGGGTTKVGDPSGKDESRKMLTDDGIQANMDSIKRVFEQFMDFEDEFDATSNKAIMVNNADWLDKLNYIKFLRDYGSLFSVNKMLSRESVKMRLEKEAHMSFLEFNYMILQAYDFVELYRKYRCRVQIGGSDQWGNIVGGIELQRKVSAAPEHREGDTSKEEGLCETLKTNQKIQIDKSEWQKKQGLFGLTTPLITTASGTKMGKTASGAVWLNADQCAPYDYWQFWRNTEDADVIKFLKLFTEVSMEEITELAKLEGAALNDIKIRLANAATALAHGEDAATEAEATAKKVFEQGGVGGDLPTFDLVKAELDAGIPAFKLFQTAELGASGGEVRRLIKGGGAKLNDVKVIDAEQSITSADANAEGIIKLSAGKKRHALVNVI